MSQYKNVRNAFPNVGKIQFSEKYVVWDDWLLTKEDVFYPQNDKQMKLCVFNSKIVSFEGKASSYIIRTRKYFESSIFCTKLWFDTSYFLEFKYQYAK